MRILKQYTTTDATATTVATIEASTDDAGVIIASVVGNSVGHGAVTGVKTVRYKKVAGTLTLGTASNTLAVEADTDLEDATFAFAAVSNNIAIQVTGKAATSIKWTVDIYHTSGN
jgi:hypothetical protein